MLRFYTRRSTEALSILDCQWVEGEEAGDYQRSQEHRSLEEGMREKARKSEMEMEIGVEAARNFRLGIHEMSTDLLSSCPTLMPNPLKFDFKTVLRSGLVLKF